MDFLKKFFGGEKGHGSSSATKKPKVCPKLEQLSGYSEREYWCDLGRERVKISWLIYSYGDLEPDHLEQYCKGQYKKCLVYRGVISK